MNRSNLLHVALTLLFILLGLAYPLLPAAAGPWETMLCPALFCVILLAITCGTFHTMVFAILVPLAEWVLYREMSFLEETVPLLAIMVVAGAFAGVVYGKFRMALASAFSGTLAAGIVYGIIRIVLNYMISDYYTIGNYLNDTLVLRWPGILLSAFGIPLLVLILRKTGAMEALRGEDGEKNGKKKK